MNFFNVYIFNLWVYWSLDIRLSGNKIGPFDKYTLQIFLVQYSMKTGTSHNISNNIVNETWTIWFEKATYKVQNVEQICTNISFQNSQILNKYLYKNIKKIASVKFRLIFDLADATNVSKSCTWETFWNIICIPFSWNFLSLHNFAIIFLTNRNF